MSSEFLTLVKKALFTAEQAERSECESQLLKIRDASIETFFHQCVQGLISEQQEPSLRQACATLLKRCLGNYSTQHQCVYWLASSAETRQQIKLAMLSLLISNVVVVRRSAADVISGICAIELPKKQWPDIITTLVQNTNHQQVEVRQAAILTLGFICEALKGINKKDCIDEEESEKILFGICQGLKQEEKDVDIKLYGVKGLQDCLSFMDQQFGKKVVRDYVTNLLLENACHENEKIRIASLQTMIDYSKIIYAFLNDYVQTFLFATAPSIKSNDPAIAIPAMEIWTAIATESAALVSKQLEASKRTNQSAVSTSQNPLVPAYLQLLPALIENLLKNEEDEEDEDEASLSIQESAYKAAAAVAESVGSQCHQLFTAFISNTISSPEWEKRKAAVLSFGALVEFSEDSGIRLLVVAAIQEISLMLNDQNLRVKKAVARVLARVAENYPETLLLHQNSLKLVEMILKSTDQPPKIAIHVMWTLSFVCENLSKFPQSPVVAHYKVVLKVLAQTTTRGDLSNQDGQILNLAFVGIQHIMHSLSDPSELTTYLDDFYNQFISTAGMDGWRREIILSGLLSVMHGCLIRYNTIVRTLQQPQIPLQKIESWYRSVVAYFTSTGEVNSDGIYLISAMATYLQKQFTPYCHDFIQTYLTHAIQKRQNVDAFKAAIYSIADIARAIGPDFTQYQTTLDFFRQLITAQDPSLDRELKLHIYSSMADVVLGVGRAAQQCAPQVIDCLQIGFQAAIKLAMSQDQELQDYSDRLKEILVPAYTSVLHAFNDAYQPYLVLCDTLPWLYQALETLSNASLKPTVEYIRSSLNLIVDIANFYRSVRPQEMKMLLASNLTKHLRMNLQLFSQQPENKDTIDYLSYIAQQLGLQIP